MLIPYKKEYEKIAMGLLSFMPGEKKVQKIQQTIDHYRASNSWHLYLWRNEDGRFVGVVGVEESDDCVYLRDLTVDPSYRNEGIANKMVKDTEVLWKTELTGTTTTHYFLEHCKEKDKHEKKGES
ncbi:GNAT family N-acetyltransferase [Salipaludibacillus sp. CUR1]|uniref:GNAT family N-acetyltransferase n=1 Tax=Salipaludibacillus sp. CUR1 TaxID=2820003 RepID=UPI001E31A20A|nr:GNAT family N-acetyltransferase [Salipaludibacillus sp. CUR1]MCE7791079.1 GNAT family N-acetyltransferase [Salipaludibacillus sp. CUR1]